MKKITEKEFDEIIKAEGKALIKFGAIWCGPCRMLNMLLKKLQSEYSEVSFYEVDIDQEPDLCKKLNISSVPVILFYNNKELTVRLDKDFTESNIKNLLA